MIAITPNIRLEYPKSLTGTKGSTQFGANFIRGKILASIHRVAKPDASVVNKYRQFLQRTYVQILKQQIPADKKRRSFGSTFSDYTTSTGSIIKGGTRNQSRKTDSSIGYASGQLKNSIKALVTIASNINTYKTDAVSGKGRYDIEFYIKPKYDFHGEYIAKGRRAGWIPIEKIITWLNTRKSLKIYIPNEKESTLKNVNREKLIKNIAYAIAKTAKKNAKPPVIKDWYDMNKDEVMYNKFMDAVKTKGSYYRTLIRKNIIDKISTLNGK